MALINCKECNKEISSKAKTCPFCGAKNNAQPSGCLTIIIIIVVVWILIRIITTFNPPTPIISDSNQSNSQIVEKEVDLIQRWEYAQVIDSMSDKKVYFAVITSNNTINLDSPYQGEQHARLTARTHPRWGKDIYFQIEKGQLLCHHYDDCLIMVKFDDKDAVKFYGTPSDDNSTELVFIKDYSRFMAMALKANTVKISIPIYQEGNPVFEFNISNFDLNKYKPKTLTED